MKGSPDDNPKNPHRYIQVASRPASPARRQNPGSDRCRARHPSEPDQPVESCRPRQHLHGAAVADGAPNKTLSTKRSICTSTTVPVLPAKDWLDTSSSTIRSACISRLATAPPPKFTSTRPYRNQCQTCRSHRRRRRAADNDFQRLRVYKLPVLYTGASKNKKKEKEKETVSL